MDQYLGMFHFSASAGLIMPGADSISEALTVQQRGEGQVPQPPGDGGPLHPWQPTGMGLFFYPDLGKMGGLFVCQCECRCVWPQRRLTSNQVCCSAQSWLSVPLPSDRVCLTPTTTMSSAGCWHASSPITSWGSWSRWTTMPRSSSWLPSSPSPVSG